MAHQAPEVSVRLGILAAISPLGQLRGDGLDLRVEPVVGDHPVDVSVVLRARSIDPVLLTQSLHSPRSFQFPQKKCLTSDSTVYTVNIQMFVISQTDKRPMYLQIMEQMKQRIAVGDWAAGQAIPSIRQLAVDIGVSVITVKRAYLELEREGVIVTRQGKGCFVALDSNVGARIREQELAQHLEQAVRSAAMMGLSPKNLERRIRAIYERVADAEKEPV